jgi:hypothetical protein
MAVRGCLLQDRLTIVVITRLVYRKVPPRSSAASARCALLNCAHAGCLAARCECVRMCMRVRCSRRAHAHAFALRDSSGLTHSQGIDLLVDVIPPICAAFPFVHFVVGGDGPKFIVSYNAH